MNHWDYLKYSPKVFYKQGSLPVYFILFITEECPVKCKHCFLANHSKLPDELSLEEIEKISLSMDPLLFLLITGGDPFLRKEIAEIVLLFYKNSRPRNVGIPSNGMYTDKIVTAAEKILTNAPKLDFAVDVSLDEIGEKHDEIRGVQGIYSKAIETFHELRKLKKHFPKFNVNVCLTVSKFNQDRLKDIYHHLRDHVGVDSINILLTRGNPRDPQAKDVDIEKYKSFVDYVDQDILEQTIKGYRSFPLSDMVNSMKMVRNNIIYRTVKEKKYILPCNAGNLSGVMMSNGDVFPCEMLSTKIGNIRDYSHNFRELWLSHKAKELSRNIVKTKCFCTHECFLSNNILFDPKTLTKTAYGSLKLKKQKMKKNLLPPSPLPQNL